MTVSSWVFSISPALAFPIWYFLKTCWSSSTQSDEKLFLVIDVLAYLLLFIMRFCPLKIWWHMALEICWRSPRNSRSWSILEYEKKWEFIYSGLQNGYLSGNFLNFLLLDVQSSTFKLV
jgi:hypothetical protein